MDTVIASDIEAIPELAASVGAANEWLVEELGQSAHPVRAEWSLARDLRDRRLVKLKLADPFAGSVVGQFAPEELIQPYHMRARLNRLWGDLLQNRTQKHLDQFREVVRQLGESESIQEGNGASSG